jgi:hypothetical protein
MHADHLTFGGFRPTYVYAAHALLLQVEPHDLQPLTFASHTYDSFHLLMPLYGELCR